MVRDEYDNILTCEEVLHRLRKILKVREGCSIIERAEDIMSFYENN